MITADRDLYRPNDDDGDVEAEGRKFGVVGSEGGNERVCWEIHRPISLGLYLSAFLSTHWDCSIPQLTWCQWAFAGL